MGFDWAAEGVACPACENPVWEAAALVVVSSWPFGEAGCIPVDGAPGFDMPSPAGRVEARLVAGPTQPYHWG